MPGLRSLVARRRSSLASPPYLSVSKTPPPYLPSTLDVVYNAQKIERRCNSLPGQVSSEVSESSEDLRPADPLEHNPVILNGLNSSSRQDSERNSDKEEQNVKPHSSSAVENHSDSSNKVSCSRSNVAVAIESKLAKRGVTVVRRMVDVDELSKATKSDMRSFSYKDSVITANPLITKEVSKPNLDGPPGQLVTVPPGQLVTVQKSGFSKHATLQQQSVLGAQNELHKQSHVKELYEKSEGSHSNPYPGTLSSQSQPVCETQASVSSSFASQSITIIRETASGSSQSYNTQSYYSQFIHQQSPKETAGSSSSSDYLNDKGTLATNMHGSFKPDSSGMPLPPGQTRLPLRSGAQCSPQSIPSYQQSKSVGHIAQYGQTPSPLSKSSEISPQPISAEMSPYSRSAEASPASRNAQQSPQSRSSQISPLSRSVKVSPQARTTELSPQSCTQMSPSIRSGVVSPQSRYVGMSPHSGSVESPHSRSSGLLSPSVSSGHKNATAPAVSESPSLPLGQSHPQGTERHMAQALPMSHTSQPGSVNTVQPDNQGRVLPSLGAASFPNIPVSDFLGRSGSDVNLYPSCNPSGVLSPQRDSTGYSSHLNSRNFSLHSTHGSYAAQSSSLTYPSLSSGYPQGANSAHFSAVPGGMVSNSNAVGFGNLSNCGGGFPLHSVSGLYPSQQSHGAYNNLHSSSGDTRSPNTSESLNYSGSRGEFALHTPYRDYALYSSSNEAQNTLRSPEGPLHNQRDIFTDQRPRESSLQTSRQIMSINNIGRETSIDPMGREPHLHRNYADQPVMLPYRESSALGRSNNSSLLGVRESAMQQNYGDHTSAYKTDLHSNTYRVPQQNDMRNNSSSNSFRDLPVLPSNNDYHSQPHIAGANNVSSFSDQSVPVGYREQNMMNNYLSSPEVPLTSNFREHASHSGSREQVLTSYQGVMNHMSPAEHANSVSTYQNSRSVSTSSSQLHPSYSETPNHTGREHLASRYQDTVSHTSPGEQTPTYGESATCTNTGGITPGYQNMRGQVNSTENCLANYEEVVDRRISRDQVMTGFSHTTSHTSPRDQTHESFKGSVNQIAAVEQSLASYQGNVNHNDPKEQPYPTFQENRSREDSSPRQPLQSFLPTVNRTDSNKINPNFGPNIDEVHPRDNVHSRFKDSEEYHSMMSILDRRDSEESCTSRMIPNYVHGAEEAINNTPFLRNSAADSYEGMQGLQNFRVHSQQKSPVAAGGNCTVPVLPSFTEFFEKASHDKLGNPKSSYYRALGDNALYSDSRSSFNPQACEAKVPETVSPCSSNRDEYADSVESDKADYDGFGDASNYEGTCVGSCDRDIRYCNETHLQCNSEFKGTPNELDPQVCKSPVKLDPKINGMEYISSPKAQFIAESDKNSNELPTSSSQRYSASGASSSTIRQSDNLSNASSLTTSSSGVNEEMVTVEKMDSGDSTEKPSSGTSPGSQERIVIKMKLLHGDPDDAEDYRSGRYSGSKEGKMDKGNHIRFPMVKYTRWTIDSIINGREVEGGSEILCQDKNKRQSDLKEVYEYDSESERDVVKSPKRSRKRRSSETLDSSKVNKFDTNKNLMKKSLKITIANPLRARFSPESKPLDVKSEYEDVTKQSFIKQCDLVTAEDEAEKPERITSSLRKIRIEQYKSNQSSSRLNVDGQLSSSSSTSSSLLVSRRQRNHGSTASEGSASESCKLADLNNSSITELKKCSIVIKRIYTDDNSSCYRSSFSKKKTRNNDHSEDGVSSPNKLMSRPKRKAAIEANERRHKSLKSFDRSLDLSNKLTSEKVPYKGPSNRYKTYVPLIDLTVSDDLTQKIDSGRDLLPLEKNGSISESSSKNMMQNEVSDTLTEISKQSIKSDLHSKNLEMSESSLPIDISKEDTRLESAFENTDAVSDVPADSSEHIIVLDFPAVIPEHNTNQLPTTKSSEKETDLKSSDKSFESNVVAVLSSENSEQDIKSELSKQTSEHNLVTESSPKFSEDLVLASNDSASKQTRPTVSTATVSEGSSVSSMTAESLSQQRTSDSCTEQLEYCTVLDSPTKSTEELQVSDSSAKTTNQKKGSEKITEKVKSDSSNKSSKQPKAPPRLSTISTRQNKASDLTTKRSKKKTVSNSPAKRTKNKIVSKSPCKSSKTNKVLNSRTKSSIKKTASEKRSRHSKKQPLSGLHAKSRKQNGVLSPCKVLVCDIFMNRRINNMKCPGCKRNYDSSDSIQVNMKRCTISFLCGHCQWLVVKDIQPREVEAMTPR